jgi:hypothetical protein
MSEQPRRRRPFRAVLAGSVAPPGVSRDLAPCSVLVDEEGTVGVVGWESAEPYGEPVGDLASFVAHAVIMLAGGGPSASARKRCAAWPIR